MKLSFPLLFAFVGCTLAGCSNPVATAPPADDPHAQSLAENQFFLHQKTFDPWILTSTDPSQPLPAYLYASNGNDGYGALYGNAGTVIEKIHGGKYDSNGVIACATAPSQPAVAGQSYEQTLDLYHGSLTTQNGATKLTSLAGRLDMPHVWQKSDIVIQGDPEAQQVTHAELFYLLNSVDYGTDHSIPPMGLSSSGYQGHIFWDAEIWMLPALLPQHPEAAKSIVDYRYRRLSSAEKLARSHGYVGAEYPWESAASGMEQAPAEFTFERHVTADVAYAAWQYYLWTGDRAYLKKEGWPVISASARYWMSRAKLGADARYHIADVIGPDETSGQVTDDAWTNAVVQYMFRAAGQAAAICGNSADPRWAAVADRIEIPFDSKAGLFLQFPNMDLKSQYAKQADTQMLIYPLDIPMSKTVAGNTLNYYIQHTIEFGPAMTSSIDAVIAARLGRAQESLDLFHEAYRPFMRGPWDALSEKRTLSNVYFMTGSGGCLQTVVYGFGGLNVVSDGQIGKGTLIAHSGDAALYCGPHLPPGWSGLTIKGVNFRGKSYTIQIASGNHVTVTGARSI